jgi:ornithine cyclodeaminase/alanine dehydrogenase-like protein (mu-crystallin family)
MTGRPNNPLVLGEADVLRIAPSQREIVAIIEETYRADAAGKVDVPSKIGVHPFRANSFVHAMPAWVASVPALGVKIVSYFPGNFAQGIHDSEVVILLFDPDNGQLVAIIEGKWLTFVRTVACAAVAAKYLTIDNPRRMGLVGCGGLGEWSLRIMTEMFPSIGEIRVSSLREQSRQAFCARFAGYGPWTIRPVDEPRQAVEDMDIVISSTPQQIEPRLFWEWLSPGALAIPLDYPYVWDDAAYLAADGIYTDDLAMLARHEERSRASGKRALRFPADRRTIQALVAGATPGRTDRQQRLFAIVTGIASTDMTVAWEIYRRARAAGLGKEISLA